MTLELTNRRFIPAARVWADRYSVTSMTGWRWERDPNRNFPKPYYIGRFKYFALDELEAWERSLPRAKWNDLK